MSPSVSFFQGLSNSLGVKPGNIYPVFLVADSSCRLHSPHIPSPLVTVSQVLQNQNIPCSMVLHVLILATQTPSHTCHTLAFSVTNILINIQGSFFKTSGLVWAVWVSSPLFSPGCCFYSSMWMSYSTLIDSNFEPEERFRSWMLNFMDQQWRPPHDSLHLGRLTKISKTPAKWITCFGREHL